MPYFFETYHVKLPKEKDRRRKLTDEDKEIIKRLYVDGIAIREIARIFKNKCSRRLIQFILFPDRTQKTEWKKYYNSDKHAKYIKSHRKYKYKVLMKDEL